MGKGGVKIPRVGRWYAIGRGVKIPWIGGLTYHGLGGQNTIGRVFDIPYVGHHNAMGRVFDIPWKGGSIYHG